MAFPGFLDQKFLEERFLWNGEGNLLQCYVLTQPTGFIGGRIVGGPWEFCVTIFDYAMGAEGWKILFYDKADKTQKVGELSSDIGTGVVSSINFNLVKTGCGDFDIVLAVDPANLPFMVEYNQGIEIYLYHDSNPWYAGYITEMPVSGSSKRPWTIKGSGYFNQLETCIVNQDFTVEEISDIVRDLMTGFVEDKTDIIYADYKILETNYTASDIRFDHETAKKAIQQLTDLAQNFIFGVDEKRELFFNGTDPSVNPLAIFSVGKHIDAIDIDENAEKVTNRIYVKAGNLAGTPKTNIRATCNDYNSQIIYGIREKVMTAPAIRDDADAERWGNWQISNLKKPKKKGKIKWADSSNGPIRAKGKTRIFDENGNKHEFAVEKVAYSIDSSGIKCSLNLGQQERGADVVLRNLLFQIANEEHLQQQNMSQL